MPAGQERRSHPPFMRCVVRSMRMSGAEQTPSTIEWRNENERSDCEQISFPASSRIWMVWLPGVAMEKEAKASCERPEGMLDRGEPSSRATPSAGTKKACWAWNGSTGGMEQNCWNQRTWWRKRRLRERMREWSMRKWKEEIPAVLVIMLE